VAVAGGPVPDEGEYAATLIRKAKAVLSGRVAFVAHFTGVADMRDVGEMHVSREGYCGLADVGRGVTNVAVVVPQSRAVGAR
jgi:hypothetical protein